MTRLEVTPRKSRSWLSAAFFAFSVTLLLGAGAGTLLINDFKKEVNERAKEDVKMIGGSVARSLAQQFEKAVRFDLTLQMIPGVEDYLGATAAASPAITRIVVGTADGQRVTYAKPDAVSGAIATADIKKNDIAVAFVEVSTDAAALNVEFDGIEWKGALIGLFLAAVAGLCAGLFVGGAIDELRRRLALALGLAASGSAASAEASMMNEGTEGWHVVAPFQALARGAGAVTARKDEIDAYAEELLAVDFDNSLGPEIERLGQDLRVNLTKPRAEWAGR